MLTKGNMITNARVNVLCKITAGGWGGVLSSATLIWQCDVINDEKRMNMINNDGNDENV